MRIVMLSDFYHPFLGGVEQHVRTLSHALVERGHDVSVVTLAHGDLHSEDTDRDVRVHRIRGTVQRLERLYRHAHRPWAPPVADPELTLSLRKVLAMEQPDIVHGHDWLARSYLPLRPRSRARFVMSLHYYSHSCAKKSLMRDGTICAGPSITRCPGCCVRHYGAPKGIATLLGNTVFGALESSWVDLFLPVSRATAVGNRLDTGDARVRVIPNFISDVRPDADVAAYVAQLPQDDFLMFVGDLRHEKGLSVLLDAYRMLSDPPPLVLIGKLWDETPDHFPERVHVFQEWPNDAVRAAWERCAIAIVPSVWPEPFGIVLLEAMAAGRPIIASRVGGIPEVVTDECSMLVTPGNAGELSSAIASLLADPQRRHDMGRMALKRVASYHERRVVADIEAQYRRLTERHAGHESTEQRRPLDNRAPVEATSELERDASVTCDPEKQEVQR